MIDTLLEEDFDFEESCDITEDALALYLTPMQERILGDVTDDAIEAAANEAASLVVTRIRLQRGTFPTVEESEPPLIVEEPTGPIPTRFERDPVI